MRERQLREEDRERLVAARWLPAIGPFGAFGRSWTVQTDEPELAALLTDLYADLAVDTDGAAADATFCVVSNDARPNSLVTRDNVRLGGGSAAATTMGCLVWGINGWLLHVASQDHLLLHAGGVVRDDGLAVVLPGPSESGKSTLTAGLLHRGFAYLSDEAVALTPDGTVLGYAKPLSIDRGSWDVLADRRPEATHRSAAYLKHQWHVRGSVISRAVASGTLGAVLFPRYDARSKPSLVRLDPSQKLLRAGTATFAAGNAPTIGLHQLQQLAEALSGVPAYELVTRDLGDACDSIHRALLRNR